MLCLPCIAAFLSAITAAAAAAATPATAPATADQIPADWGSVSVQMVDGRWEAILRNRQLYIKYARSIVGGSTKDKIVDLSVIVDGQPRLVGFAVDTRHSNGRQDFFLLTDARVVEDGAARKTVQLTFGDNARVQKVSIYPDSRIFSIEYFTFQPSRHSCDLRLTGDTFFAYGAEEWRKLRGWPMLYPKINDRDKTGDDAYYRQTWGPPGPLSCNGRLIVGRFDRETGTGLGTVVPFDRLDWFKFTRSNGLERMMKGAPCTVHHFVVTGGADEIDSVGRRIAAGAGS